jgi:hypothetical protein
MSNAFLVSTIRQIEKHGQTMTYKAVTEGAYNIETGSTTNTDTSYTVKMYKRHIRANQYNYPNLIGQDAATFYLANHKLAFVPSIRDKIIVDSNTYIIDSITEHRADGQIVLYRILAIKG